MSAKNRDNKNRWRNITVGFRVSPEENERINKAVALSGLPKQEYCYRRCLNQDVVVQGNPRVYKALKLELALLRSWKGNRMKQIQIPEQLFMELVKFHLLDMEENLPSIKQGLEAKLDSLVMRDLYSKYKTAPTEEEREQMSVLVGDVNAFMPHTVCNRHRRKSHINEQTDVAVPLRYNNDKQKKPLFSRGLSVCRLLFNSFSKLKIDENYKEKRRLFY